MTTAILFLLALLILFGVWVCLNWNEAVRLNFTAEIPDMAKIGTIVRTQIAPTNAAGLPAPVFDVSFGEDSDSWQFASPPDGLTCTFIAVAAGPAATATVVATTKGGVALTASLELPEVEAAPDEEAVALNFSIVEVIEPQA